MVLTTTFRAKGREYSLSLDTEKADRNYDDENYAEWLFDKEDERVIVITVWKDSLGRLTKDAIVEVYNNRSSYNDGFLMDKKSIKVKPIE